MPSISRPNPLESWVLRHLGSVEHERRVSVLASSLFHLTQPLHDLDPSHLRLLRLAATVHDVGRAIDNKTHPAQGAHLLLDDPLVPLSGPDRRALAYLTLYHRGPVPESGRDTILRDSDDRDRLRSTLSLLRAADALDSRSMESPRVVFSLSGHGGRIPTLHIRCYLETESAKARRIYRRRKKFRLLEQETPLPGGD